MQEIETPTVEQTAEDNGLVALVLNNILEEDFDGDIDRLEEAVALYLKEMEEPRHWAIEARATRIIKDIYDIETEAAEAYLAFLLGLYGVNNPSTAVQVVEDTHPTNSGWDAWNSFSESYIGTYDSIEEAAEDIFKTYFGFDNSLALDAVYDCIDFEQFWNRTLRHDFHEINETHFFRNI